MDRVIVNPGQIPLDTDVLATNQNAMIGQGWLAQALFGTNAGVVGMAVTANPTPAQNVIVAPGAVTSLQTLEGSAYGSLPTTNNATPLTKMGILLAAATVTIPWTAITAMTTGQAINVLIEAAFSETDGASSVLSYYNATNPTSPYLGPSNSGTPNNTRRIQGVTLTAKVGTAATSGSQTTPTLDTNNVALAVVTIPFGATTVITGYLSVAPLFPGPVQNLATLTAIPHRVIFNTPGAISWTVPPGIYSMKASITGAGGGGAGCDGTHCGGGGGAGATIVMRQNVSPGDTFTGTIGAAGTAGGSGAGGGAGGASSLTYVPLSTTKTGGGGSGGTFGATPAGGAGGTAAGSDATSGGDGTDGLASNLRAGDGGASFWGGGTRGASNNTATAAVCFGAGGGGGYGTTGSGGAGAPGRVVIEY